MKKMAIIGGGNLGQAIAEGLISSSFIAPEQITISRRNVAALSALAAKGVQVTSDNVAAIDGADWIILAVKPFQVKEILSGLLPHMNAATQALISVMTGVSLSDLTEMTGPDFTIFRAMPNTAIAIKESITCLCALNASTEQHNFVTDIFNKLGLTVAIEESMMDAATVLGACGTAFAMRFIRANIQGGIEIGFDAKTAALIAAQTVKGAAELLLQRNTHPEQEIDKVTTPKGCTIAGLNEMEHQGFSSSLIKGIVTSYKKIKNDM
ncbi:pyrroline-5-carboxylate reductase [Taibaiella sp. KBW10]|uniref:pyrroline-5-carboxylate reductase n=1 Tax=Taibaiella sp. KBW10 TaxID=2153357 RepID=UPI000F5955D8|nr:pyrroline-5-carboxylate reductase [Taibaiella sp. KBW10]RQO32048.1 pyrroline-5-carboxylate reductase [Taibaiella sp. KBW10]